MAGQINRGSFLGECVYKLSVNKEFKNYVEVGTWNGEGSTKCFMDGLMSRFDDSTLYSLEANIQFYEEATRYWAPILMVMKLPSPKLHLLYGRIVEATELVSEEEVREHSRFGQHPWLEWRERNIKEYGQCKSVLDQLPDEIDVLLLDGGQFSTRAEFHKLKDRSKVVLLDDTQSFKTERARLDMLADPETWTVIVDNLLDRHGIFIACRTEYQHLLGTDFKGPE
tara:strand:- start:2478 stop:3152 length:675 start_codon:yes stop_codon:yes gene_type:complete